MGPSCYAQTKYYYLPDVQKDFDIKASQFIYFGSGRWVRPRYLPRQYRNYDLNSGYKVLLDNTMVTEHTRISVLTEKDIANDIELETKEQ
ncbi:MAG: hypothetical protein ACI9M1_002388 [Porticoccaceae bacterium]|jgi:hypothetical protein